MTPPNSTIATALAVALLLSGCVSGGEFPSLALRDAELDRSTESPGRAPVEVPSDAALRQQVQQLTDQARAGETAFERAHDAVAAAVAAAGSVGSESWVEAQQALSRLEAARAETMRALGDLDALAMDRAGAPTSADDLALLNAAIATVERLALGQQRRFDLLQARLSR